MAREGVDYCEQYQRFRTCITKSGRKYGPAKEGLDPLALCSKRMEYVTASRASCKHGA